MGGSGKTPMSDFLIEKLHSRFKIAYLSRGYKRESKGFVLANENTGLAELGDENYMLFQKWKDKVVFAVDANRKEGIEKLKVSHPEIDLILLDDAMQHRWVKPKICIQLSPFDTPFFRNYVFPSGTLRDNKQEYKRADFLIFTKAKIADKENLNAILLDMKQNGIVHEQVFVSNIQYLRPVNQALKRLELNSEVVAVSGLANNLPFFEMVKSVYSVQKVISKSDHYGYLPNFFAENGLNGKTILCTEKDFYKLIAIAPEPDLIYYLPISIQIYPEQKFLTKLDEAIYS